MLASTGCNLFRETEPAPDEGPADVGADIGTSDADESDVTSPDLSGDDVGVACSTTVEVERDPDVVEHLRSIGAAGQLFSTKATVTARSDVVCLTDPLPPSVGAGDRIDFATESLFIYAVVDPTTVVLETAPPQAHVDESVTIRRAFARIPDWEEGRQGDLVRDNRREIGLLHNDDVFTVGTVFQGSTTDATHYMHLTVEPGSRHNGVAGTGVVVRPTAPFHGFHVLDDYARISWVEITQWSVGSANSYDGIDIQADGVVVDHVIIHDDGAVPDSNPDCNGITVEKEGVSASISNSIVYNIARSGFTIHTTPNAFLELSNSSAWNCKINDTSASYGCVAVYASSGSTLVAHNVIATGVASGADFYDSELDQASFAGSSNNVSSDDSAPGSDSMTAVSSDSLFVSVETGLEDLHLREGSPAIDGGLDLSPNVVDDIDGETRPAGTAYDIGADELQP